MVFISRKEIERKKGDAFFVGDEIVLLRDIEVIAGIFEKGTLMTITELHPRGYGMKDFEGHSMNEVPFIDPDTKEKNWKLAE